MKIKYFGHSCFLVEFAGKKLLFDPFISGNPLATAIKPETIEADYILISHGHGDHVADAVEIAKRTGAKIISNFEIMSWYEAKGLSGYGMNIGGKVTLDGFTVKNVVAIHSSVLPDGTYGGNPMGFVIWDKSHCFYYSGDTALTIDMQLIPRICPPLDFAIMAVGDYFTMGFEDAILAADFAQVNKVIGCHFDSFPPIKIDHHAAKAAFSAADKELILPGVGDIIEV
ncbi:MAG: metal-dependent hydrolase [Cytophagaceae bacterium]|nr:metal-dependent hydrolase [Cytophagaceae bacterium]MBK9509217.1 metal-dependent hydrolase [Cytophagaceae bacterium]MBK9933786.1 metal-dependent hydrolase [Cytophagaceae bacterium]MBL0302499.1 metal-dependent hydrolase [Cytophagaceae bacterium]MBL0325326.1 metal-dependent hydrolase [Cytophagaceae bacterium]